MSTPPPLILLLPLTWGGSPIGGRPLILCYQTVTAGEITDL